MGHRSFLSPLDGYTDMPFRLLCQRYGADSACVPLVNSTAISFDSSKISRVDAHEDEKNLGVQLVGDRPETMGLAAGIIAKKFGFVSWFNINCGCPSERTMGSGGGSALLAQPDKIVESVREVEKTGKPVSVKIRISKKLDDTISLCRLLEKAGVAFIIIHGRTPQQHYTGKADWEAVKRVKNELGVQVVGNGDLKTAAEGLKRVKDGYCDSYMVGRAAMTNPMLFSDREPANLGEKFGLLDEYLTIHREYVGEPELKDVKLKAMNFVSGAVDAGKLRNSIARSGTIEKIVALRDAQ